MSNNVHYGMTFRLRLLGDFQLFAHNRLVTNLDVPRVQSLLGYLVLHRDVPVLRSRLAYLLWPDSSDGQAHTNLRNLLHKLRVAFPDIDPFLRIERNTLSWHSDVCWQLDVQDFECALARAELAAHAQDNTAERQALEEAVQLYQGDLLPNCYDDWMQGERDRLQQLYVTALERLSELLEEERNYAAAVRVAQRFLRYDPLQEAAYRRLMRLHAKRGDRGAISRVYQSCITVLQRELSVVPSIKTRTTYEQLMRAEA